MNHSNKILSIVGPTGSGKTGLALRLLDNLRGEIVSADSRQVYKGLDYTTNKLGPKEDVSSFTKHEGYWTYDSKRINLYDIIEINQTMSVGAYVEKASALIEQLLDKNTIPVITGGTGYYVSSLLGESSFGSVEHDEDLRDDLENLSEKELVARLQSIDPLAVEGLNASDAKNRQRLIRFIEIATSAGSIEDAKQYSPLKKRIDSANVEVKKIGLTASREYLYNKGDVWIDELVVHPSFKEEMELIFSHPHVSDVLSRGLIYNQALAQRDGTISYDEMVQKMKYQIHQYIKRQQIWFNRFKDIEWVDVTSKAEVDKMVASVNSWYIS